MNRLERQMSTTPRAHRPQCKRMPVCVFRYRNNLIENFSCPFVKSHCFNYNRIGCHATVDLKWLLGELYKWTNKCKGFPYYVCINQFSYERVKYKLELGYDVTKSTKSHSQVGFNSTPHLILTWGIACKYSDLELFVNRCERKSKNMDWDLDVVQFNWFLFHLFVLIAIVVAPGFSPKSAWLVIQSNWHSPL